MNKLNQKINNILDKQDLAENSKKTYINHFNKVKILSGHTGFSFNFLKDVDRISKLIEESGEKDTTKKMMFISISSIALGARGLKKKSELYKKKSLEITKKLNEQYSENELNKKQRETLITHEELLKKVDILKEMFDKKPNKTNRKKYILGLLYLDSLFTPRLEYAIMKIIKRKEEDNNKDNFMLVKNSGIVIILNDYKTKKKYGKITFKIEGDIEKKLKNLNIGSQQFVFESNKGGSMRKNKFSEFIKNTFDGISLNGVRIIKETFLQKLSFFQSLSVAQQEKKHIQLFQHSSFTARSVYRKKDLN